VIFRYDEENNSVSTINGTLGWPTDEAENDQFAEPLSTVSQLVVVPPLIPEVPDAPPLDAQADDAFNRERDAPPEVVVVRVSE
jgi:hypothetical protein